jgi:hypothetical protein
MAEIRHWLAFPFYIGALALSLVAMGVAFVVVELEMIGDWFDGQ